MLLGTSKAPRHSSHWQVVVDMSSWQGFVLGLFIGFTVGIYLLQVQPILAIVIQLVSVVLTVLVGFQRVGAVALNHGQRFLIGIVASNVVLGGVMLFQVRPLWIPVLIAFVIVGLAVLRQRLG